MSEVERKERFRSLIDRTSQGMEIGPSFNPVAPKAEGFNVHTVDHLDQAGLVEKYSTHNVNVSAIEPVDFIWKGGSLADAVGRDGQYDWIIASHVIEHLPDIIGFVKDCQRLLRPSGLLILGVPDKRFCFDYLRFPTSTGAVIQAHLEKRVRHSAGQVYGFFAHSAKLGEAISWARGRAGEIQYLHEDGLAEKALDEYLSNDEYVDVHAWVFTPSSFRLIFQDLNHLGVLQINEHSFVETIDCEFLIAFSNEPAKNPMSRLALAKMALHELREVHFP